MPKYDCTGMWYSILHLKWLQRQRGNFIRIYTIKGRIYVAFFMLVTLKFKVQNIPYSCSDFITGRFRNLESK